MKSDKINMKIIAFLWTAIFLSTMVATPVSSQESPKADHLALGSYNIRNARGMDERLDYDRIAQVISRMRVDAIALQELDSATHRSEGLYVLGELAKRTGLRATFAPAIEFDGGKYGIGILSQETPISVQRIPLPGEEEKRTLLVTEFKRYVLACVHFSLTEKDRLASIPLILDALDGYAKPVFLAGDWNDTPHSPFLQEIEKRFILLSDTASPTYPAPAPTETLDYIALLKKTTGTAPRVKADVIEAREESDHRPVRVEWSPK